MAMTLQDFEQLDTAQQLRVVEWRGVLVGEREDLLHAMFLYQVYSFYVELAYQKGSGALWRVGPFDHPILLQPYLDQIDLATLLE